jgi:hypothetical protein
LIEKAPFLEIKIKEGDALSKSDVIKINAMGRIESLRINSDDHYVYFGSAKIMNE